MVRREVADLELVFVDLHDLFGVEHVVKGHCRRVVAVGEPEVRNDCDLRHIPLRRRDPDAKCPTVLPLARSIRSRRDGRCRTSWLKGAPSDAPDVEGSRDRGLRTATYR